MCRVWKPSALQINYHGCNKDVCGSMETQVGNHQHSAGPLMDMTCIVNVVNGRVVDEF